MPSLPGLQTDPNWRLYQHVIGADIFPLLWVSGQYRILLLVNMATFFSFLPLGELPFLLFELRIITPEGKVIRGIQRSDPDDPYGTRFRIKMGKGYGDGIRIEATRERVTVDVPEPQTRWSKLWAELGIFIGVAGLLAL